VTIGSVVWHDAGAMGGSATTGGVTLGWASATDVGVDRSVNEDAVLARPPVFVVADGMGGHQAGDVASGLLVGEFSGIADGRLRAVEDVLQVLESANSTILVEGQRTARRTGMGTTAVGLLLVDDGEGSSWMLFNVGDSRAYRFAGGSLEQISVDHSYVQELVDAGEISERSARTHPHRNVVTRALGVEEGLHPDVWLRAPTAGERFLLCSDGLSSEIDDEEIQAVLADGSADAVVRALVAHALTAGGHDNVTVLVVDVTAVEEDGRASGTTAPRDQVADGEVEEVPVTDDLSAAAHDGLPVTDAVTPDAGGLIDRVPGQDELDDMAGGETT
jgi:protein phosphatase